MFVTHLVRHAARFAALAAIVGTLTGCGAIVNGPTLSQVRIIATSPDAPALDIYRSSHVLAYNLGFGTVTSYVTVPAGTYTIAARPAGTRQLLVNSRSTFATPGQYTVLIGDTAANLRQLTLKDQSQPAPPGQTALRFIDQATRLTALDLYLVPPGQKLAAVTPVVSNLTFGANTGYLNLPSGTYTLVLVPTGTIPVSTTVATYNGAQITYSSGSAHTIILIDQPPSAAPGLQVITAADVDSPTDTN
ncbi:MAG TPA: DUF4397 domain-containing protein [Edaphobacter sp.]|jgi:hypothetical protein|nr:DUF4397 domain-containing protein [Edaphobacter sp.]